MIEKGLVAYATSPFSVGAVPEGGPLMPMGHGSLTYTRRVREWDSHNGAPFGTAPTNHEPRATNH